MNRMMKRFCQLVLFSTLIGSTLLSGQAQDASPAEEPLPNEQNVQAIVQECEEAFLNIAFKMAFAESGVDLDSAQTDGIIKMLEVQDPEAYQEVRDSARKVCAQLQKGIRSGMKDKQKKNHQQK